MLLSSETHKPFYYTHWGEMVRAAFSRANAHASQEALVIRRTNWLKRLTIPGLI